MNAKYELLQKCTDIQAYSGVGSENGTLTAYRTEDGIELIRGCFQGGMGKFRDAVEKKKYGKNSKIGRSYFGICVLIEDWFGIKSVRGGD